MVSKEHKRMVKYGFPLIFSLLIALLFFSAPARGAGLTSTTAQDLEKSIEFIQSRYVDQVPPHALIKAFCETVAGELEKNRISARELKYLTFSSDLKENIAAIDRIFNSVLSPGKGPARELIIQKGIEGMVLSLKDDGTRYYAPGSYHVRLVESSTSRGGVGMYVDEEKDRQGRFVIVDTLEGFPAERASLKAGDRITKAGGKEVKDLQFHQLAELIIGDRGTPLNLTVEQGGSSTPTEVTLERVALTPGPRTFSTKSLSDTIGLMRFKFLGFRMEPDTAQALTEMKASRGLILDLRNNAGYPQAAISLTGLFLSKDTPIATEVLRDSEKVFVAKNEGSFKLPMVILVNEFSSSASTIMAEALRHAGRAKLVGTPTRWRYSSNEKLEMPDGSVITVTVSYFKLPDGKTVRNRGEGVSPDISVPQDPFTMSDPTKDRQLEKAMQLLMEKAQ